MGALAIRRNLGVLGKAAADKAALYQDLAGLAPNPRPEVGLGPGRAEKREDGPFVCGSTACAAPVWRRLSRSPRSQDARARPAARPTPIPASPSPTCPTAR